MGKPNQRLRTQVRELVRRGRLYRGRYVHVRLGGGGEGRLLISVRRRFGNAVVRNRARRRLRALCRELGVMGSQGRMILISVGDHASGASYGELQADLVAAFVFLGVIQR